MRSSVEDFLLGPGTGEKERNAAQRHHANGVGDKRNWHQFSEAAHLSNVLFMVSRVDDRARAKEKQSFKKSVSEQMHDAGRDTADTERNHHEAELGNR